MDSRRSDGVEAVNIGILSSRTLIRKALVGLLQTFGRVDVVLDVNSGVKAFAAVV